MSTHLGVCVKGQPQVLRCTSGVRVEDKPGSDVAIVYSSAAQVRWFHDWGCSWLSIYVQSEVRLLLREILFCATLLALSMVQAVSG